MVQLTLSYVTLQVDGAACELPAAKAQKAAAKEGVKKKRESQKLAKVQNMLLAVQLSYPFVVHVLTLPEFASPFKLKQDRNRAILQQKTYRKEQKVAEVRLSVEACKVRKAGL